MSPLKWLKTFNMWVWLFRRPSAANLRLHTLHSTRLQKTFNSESTTSKRTISSCLISKLWDIVQLNGSAPWRCCLRDSTRRTLYHWLQTERSATPTAGFPSTAELVPVSAGRSQKQTCACSYPTWLRSSTSHSKTLATKPIFRSLRWTSHISHRYGSTSPPESEAADHSR